MTPAYSIEEAAAQKRDGDIEPVSLNADHEAKCLWCELKGRSGMMSIVLGLDQDRRIELGIGRFWVVRCDTCSAFRVAKTRKQSWGEYQKYKAAQKSKPQPTGKLDWVQAAKMQKARAAMEDGKEDIVEIMESVRPTQGRGGSMSKIEEITESWDGRGDEYGGTLTDATCDSAKDLAVAIQGQDENVRYFKPNGENYLCKSLDGIASALNRIADALGSRS